MSDEGRFRIEITGRVVWGENMDNVVLRVQGIPMHRTNVEALAQLLQEIAYRIADGRVTPQEVQ